MRYGWRVRKKISAIAHDDGCAYVAGTNLSRLSSHDMPSSAILLEDGVRLAGPSNALHDDIRKDGGGNYSFWYDCVYFSTSDGSDPRSNGRCYEIEYGFWDTLSITKRLRMAAHSGRYPLMHPLYQWLLRFFAVLVVGKRIALLLVRKDFYWRLLYWVCFSSIAFLGGGARAVVSCLLQPRLVARALGAR